MTSEVWAGGDNVSVTERVGRRGSAKSLAQ